jgi:hypothetical protein
MRRHLPRSEMNILVTFKKFDTGLVHRGYITPDNIHRVLKAEGKTDEYINSCILDIMSSDSDGDGKVSFRDLYERVTERVPEEWLDWIYENVTRGVDNGQLLEILRDNGFKEDIALSLIERTRKRGRQSVERSYADLSHEYIYTLRS